MKKLFAIVLVAMMMVLSCAAVASAEGEFKGTVNIGHLAVMSGADDYLGTCHHWDLLINAGNIFRIIWMKSTPTAVGSATK